MGHHARLCEERERLCFHLESAIELYKDTEQAAHPHDRLAVQSVLRDIRHVLWEDEDFEPLRRKDVIRLKKLLQDLRNHVNMIALKCLVDDVWNIQMRVENIEQCREGASHHRSIPSTTCQLPVGDNQMWNRLSEKRKELLGPSSLMLKMKPSFRRRRVSFDRDSTKSKCKTEHNKKEKKPNTTAVETDALIQEKIERLKDFLKERNCRRRKSKASHSNTSEAVKRAHCLLHRSENSRYEARRARKQSIGEKQEPEAHCEECFKLLRERNQFWGQETESDSDYIDETVGPRHRKASEVTEKDIKDFLDSLSPGEDLYRSSVSESFVDEAVPVELNSSCSPQAFIIKQKPVGVAGKGTWATPAYVPPWTVLELEKGNMVNDDLRDIRKKLF